MICNFFAAVCIYKDSGIFKISFAVFRKGRTGFPYEGKHEVAAIMQEKTGKRLVGFVADARRIVSYVSSTSFQGRKDLSVVDRSIPVAGVVVSVVVANFEAVATIKVWLCQQGDR